MCLHEVSRLQEYTHTNVTKLRKKIVSFLTESPLSWIEWRNIAIQSKVFITKNSESIHTMVWLSYAFCSSSFKLFNGISCFSYWMISIWFVIVCTMILWICETDSSKAVLAGKWVHKKQEQAS